MQLAGRAAHPDHRGLVVCTMLGASFCIGLASSLRMSSSKITRYVVYLRYIEGSREW